MYLELAHNINPDTVNAKFTNGVLTLSLDKQAHSQKSKKIEINKH